MGFPKPNGRPAIVGSILAADPARLGDEVRAAERAGADGLSVDVMDGAFVPNLSFGPHIAAGLRSWSRLPTDAHLMVERPDDFIEPFVKAGADLVTVHLEACRQPRAVIRRIKALGAKAGMALRPKTPAKKLLPFLDELDLALVMTVEPGFGGQAFMTEMLPKVRELRAAIGRRPIWLQVDGGVNAKTVGLAAEAGADSLVAGSALFGAQDKDFAVAELREKAERAGDFAKQVARR